MAKIQSFEKFYQQYDSWFDQHPYVYQSELVAVRRFIQDPRNAVEIGMGSGRFAQPLGIKDGIEPSYEMRKLAQQKGLNPRFGIAEQLPVADQTYDLALMVTTICFVDNPLQAIREMYRIISTLGSVVIGFVDKDSPIGQIYRKHKHESRFYQQAHFFAAREIETMLLETGFCDIRYVQTLFGQLDEVDQVQQVLEGCGQGSFVVVKGVKR